MAINQCHQTTITIPPPQPAPPPSYFHWQSSAATIIITMARTRAHTHIYSITVIKQIRNKICIHLCTTHKNKGRRWTSKFTQFIVTECASTHSMKGKRVRLFLYDLVNNVCSTHEKQVWKQTTRSMLSECTLTHLVWVEQMYIYSHCISWVNVSSKINRSDFIFIHFLRHCWIRLNYYGM